MSYISGALLCLMGTFEAFVSLKERQQRSWKEVFVVRFGLWSENSGADDEMHQEGFRGS